MRVTGIALLGVAAILFLWGLDASGTIPSALPRFIRDVATHQTPWIFAGGVGAGVLGLGLLLAPRYPVA
jgi:hypothetical protein